MNRDQLEHVIRAAGDVLGEDRVVIVGSQAALGQFPDDLPHSVLLSREADVTALFDPTGEKALRINGAIGEDTRFDSTFGYYAEGVEPGLSQFPPGWKERLVVVSTPATGVVTGLCPEIHDLAVAKLLAGRPKDVEWALALLQSGHVAAATLLERAAATEMRADQRSRIARVVRRAGLPGRRYHARRDVRRLLATLEESDSERRGDEPSS